MVAIRPRLTTLRADHAVGTLASAQDGVVTRTQLAEAGLSPTQIRERIASGILRRVHRGVYAVGHDALSERGVQRAALLAVGGDSALSHTTAAVSLRMLKARHRSTIVHVTTSTRTRARLRGIRVHLVRSLPREHVTTRDGLRMTASARTVVDLGDSMDPWRLTNVMHEAEFHQLLDAPAIQRVLDSTRQRPGPGHAVAGRALAMLRAGSAGTKSELERRVLRALLRAGVPEPRVNVQMKVARGSIEVDLYWPKAALCVEVDGGGHGRQRSKRQDARRDARLRAAGMRVIRLPAAEIERSMARSVGRVVKALGKQ